MPGVFWMCRSVSVGMCQGQVLSPPQTRHQQDLRMAPGTLAVLLQGDSPRLLQMLLVWSKEGT